MLLDGVRVLDLTQFLPGGYCTRLLADMGAEVTKVEASTRGDPIRSLPNGEKYFEALHHGKPVVQLALKTEAGRGRLLQLIETADVLLEGFRPGVMDRRQVGWSQLRAVNPRLIYCSITGYGSRGTLRDRAGHDLNYLARSGALSVMPRVDGVPMIPGVQVADVAGGMMAAIAVLGAVIERQRTGQGRRLDISMTDVAKSWLVLERAAFDAGFPMLNLIGGLPCYHVYRAADGLLTVGALEPNFWRNFCEAIGREDLIARQTDPGAIAEVAGVLKDKTRAEWMAIFGDRDVCVEPVLDLSEASSPAVPIATLD
jgi:crotonobetainyl-CoA:carnitine CoA-transferase CaiB-like acyl-CoA transferase